MFLFAKRAYFSMKKKEKTQLNATLNIKNLNKMLFNT